MDLYSFLATIILITSIVSLVMAFAAYVAYKVREIRKPQKNKRLHTSGKIEPIFLNPVDTKSLLNEWNARPTEDKKSAPLHTK